MDCKTANLPPEMTNLSWGAIKIICNRKTADLPSQMTYLNAVILSMSALSYKDLIPIFFFFLLVFVLRPFQDFFTYFEPIVNQKWDKKHFTRI